MRKSRYTKLRIAAVVGVTALLLAAFALATVKLFLSPSTSDARHADAVVVFGARSRPERLPAALEMMQEGAAPVLVLSSPPEDPRVCRDRPRYEVICRTPDPFSTRGEARVVGELADERRWRSVILVTSTYHLTRARLLLGRCFDGEIHGIAADPSDGAEGSLESITHEWLGMLAAMTFARGC